MKVILLDIDGVLDCEKTRNPRKFPHVVDRLLLARLEKLLDRTGAKVVLSSSGAIPLACLRRDTGEYPSSACVRIVPEAHEATRYFPGFPIIPK
jgi:hypothetical protein